MTRRGTKHAGKNWRRRLSGVGVGLAAAAIATSTSAPAQADIEDLLDPIVQPIVSSLTDSIALFDPAAALDFTSWADELLDSLNAFDFLFPTTDSAFAAAASGALPAADVAAAPANAVIPMELLIGTEPAVYATVNGGTEAVPLLVDTGSAGLVIPSSLLGDDYWERLENLFELGLPSGIGSSGYTGGVNYIYFTYDSVPIDYTNLAGTETLFETDGPVNIEVYSYAPGNFASLFTNDAFEKFLDGNSVDGILGIGLNPSGPTETPFLDYDGVLVDIPNGQLVIGDYDTTGWASTDGAPITQVIQTVGGVTRTVTVNIDSGGVFGTIPSSLAPSGSTLGDQIAGGTTITVTNLGGDPLYSYVTGQTDISNDGSGVFVDNGPYVVSSNSINSGVLPFLNHQVYLDYGDNTTSFSPFIPSS